MNERLLYLSTALGWRQVLSIGLGFLPSIVDGDLEGNGKERVHVLKEVVEVDFIRLLFTDEAPQMPFHIHSRNLGSYSTPPAFLTCLRYPFRLLLNNLGASYHLHPSGST